MSKQMLAKAAEEAKAGRLDQAIASLKVLLAGEPHHEVALGMLGGIYAQIGMHDRAIAQFQKVLSLNPGQPLARLQLGTALIETQRYAEAIDTLAPLCGDVGEYAANFYSALALIQLGRVGEAKPLLQKAAENIPRNHPAFPQIQELLGQIGGGVHA